MSFKIDPRAPGSSISPSGTEPPKAPILGRLWTVYWKAYHEGMRMETMPCNEYCRVKTEAVAGKTFNSCMDECHFAQLFADWHRKS